MQMRKYAYKTADSEHCFDLSGLISGVDVTDIYSRQYILEREGIFCLWFVTVPVTKICKKKTLRPTRSHVKKRGTKQVLCLCMQPRKHSECQRLGHNL